MILERKAELDRSQCPHSDHNVEVKRHDGAWQQVMVLPGAAMTVDVPAPILGPPPIASEETGPVTEEGDEEGGGMFSKARYHDVDVLMGELNNCKEVIAELRQQVEGMRRYSIPKRPLPVMTNGQGKLPTYGYPGDAGLDLFVSDTVTVYPGDFVDIPCDVSIALPPGVWGLITGRSSTLRKRSLLVAQGVIDGGYRGALFAGVWNLGKRKAVVEAGDRVAQLILFQNLTELYEPVWAESLDETSRGGKGFGSSGQ